MAGPAPRTAIFDQFLPADLHARLLDYTLSSAAAFIPSRVHLVGDASVRDDYRIAHHHRDGLGPLKQTFRDVAKDNFACLADGAGVKPFEVDWIELELAAHGDGAFFLPHIDTRTGDARTTRNSDRVLTAVYYFHREPKGFSGGNLEVHPFGGGPACQVIEPQQNRMVCFASTVLHQVSLVSCPSGKFEDNRFALNFWYHRAK